MPKERNPLRTKFSKASTYDQLKLIKKLLTPNDDLKQVINRLFTVDPYVSIRQDGRISLFTDKHLFN